MNSFERGPSPEQFNKEARESEEEEEGEEEHKEEKETQEALEQNLDADVAIAEEKGTLEHFKGKAKDVAKVMLLASVLSVGPVGPGIAQGEDAQKAQPSTRIERVKQGRGKEQKIEINEANITASSEWSGEIIESAKSDMGKVKTAEDAEWLVRSHFNQFISEYYMPTKGKVKEGPYGTKTRDYTEDDLKYLLQNAQEMKGLVQELDDKFGLEAFDKRMNQINNMITKLESQSSYSGQKKKESLEKLEKMLEQQ